MIFDAHAHLFSRWFYRRLVAQARGGEVDDEQVREAIEPLGLAWPPADPAEHADRWVEQLDAHSVDAMVLFTSLPGEQEAVAAACAAHPDRLVGYTMVNPHAADWEATLKRDLTQLERRGIELFPAMHRFDPSDAKLEPLYALAAEHGVPVFCHVGLMRVPLREKLGLPSPFDMRYSDPMLLHRAAADHGDVAFIIPHLGCGYLREAALLGAACPNVYIDTSSSNSWLKLAAEPTTFEAALRVCLEAFTPRRVLFGTDSSTFPRGYRHDLLDRTRKALNTLGVDEQACRDVMGGNLARLLRWRHADKA